ncbi:hypothetical protein DFH09DRAFT_1098539 [Mycena vulgaris]|nr:hypothetical protein DFH09DRAFT_1098539 [Mycena vulgaris]
MYPRYDPNHAVQVLAASSRRWNDVHILMRILKACEVKKNTDLLGVEDFASCCQIFRWSVLREFWDRAMDQDADPSFSLWCQNHDKANLRSLRNIEGSDIPSLLERSLTCGGVFLRDMCLEYCPESPGLPSENEIRASQGDPDKALDVIKLCIGTDHAELCWDIFAKMRDAAACGAFVSTYPPWRYYRAILNAEAFKGRDSHILEELARSVAREFTREGMPDSESLQAQAHVSATLVRATIAAFRAPSAVNDSSLNWRDQLKTPVDRMIGLHAPTTLTPFFPIPRSFLVEQVLDLEIEPFKGFATGAVKAYADDVMTEKPEEVIAVAEIESVGCQVCTYFAGLRALLLGEHTMTSFRHSNAILTHLEHKLTRTSVWGVDCEILVNSCSRILKVMKPESMTAFPKWYTDSRITDAALTRTPDVGSGSWQRREVHTFYSSQKFYLVPIWFSKSLNPPPTPTIHVYSDDGEISMKSPHAAPGVNMVWAPAFGTAVHHALHLLFYPTLADSCSGIWVSLCSMNQLSFPVPLLRAQVTDRRRHVFGTRVNEYPPPLWNPELMKFTLIFTRKMGEIHPESA